VAAVLSQISTSTMVLLTADAKVTAVFDVAGVDGVVFRTDPDVISGSYLTVIVEGDRQVIAARLEQLAADIRATVTDGADL
jgi:hypothetical protein